MSQNLVPAPGSAVTAKEIALMIDHSLLKPEMTEEEVVAGCKLADEYGCATVCVKPCDVELAAKTLAGSSVLVTTVIGFPHGHHLAEVKLLEADAAIKQGCKELDLVLNIGRLLSGDFDLVEDDIRAVCDLSHKSGVIVKVILENAYLTPDLIKQACEICERAGADFVKTSTGYAKTGATLDDLRLMRATCSENVSVKAAGGVRSLDSALSVRAVGAIRFGATATRQIVEDAREREAAGTLKIPESASELTIGY